jgi:hypothetical protein
LNLDTAAAGIASEIDRLSNYGDGVAISLLVVNNRDAEKPVLAGKRNPERSHRSFLLLSRSRALSRPFAFVGLDRFSESVYDLAAEASERVLGLGRKLIAQFGRHSDAEQNVLPGSRVGISRCHDIIS